MRDMRWDDERHARIVALANEAVLRPDRWDTLVNEIGSTLGASGAALFSPAPDPKGLNLSASFGTATEALPEFALRWATEDPWIKAIGCARLPWRGGTIYFGDELVAPPTLFRTAFYNDFSRPHDIENIVSLKVIDDHEPFAPPTHLSLYQTRGHGALFGKTQRSALAGLWPHLRRAIRAHGSLRNARDADRIAEEALDAVPQPIWVLRDDLAIDHANRQAHELMSSATWVLAAAHRLSAIGDLDSRALREAVRSADMGGGRISAAAVPLAGRLRRVLLRVAPLRGVASYAAAWPHARALLMLELPPADGEGTVWMARLAAHYGLTPAERRVLERLCAGLSPQQIADEMRVSYTTTRAQLRALFSKTGCHRQAELVRLGIGG